MTLDLLLGATPKGWKKSIEFPDAELYAKSFFGGEKKKSLKKINYSRSLSDPENSWCGHQQPYNFFSVFTDFQTLPDNSGKPKSVDSKQKN